MQAEYTLGKSFSVVRVAVLILALGVTAMTLSASARADVIVPKPEEPQPVKTHVAQAPAPSPAPAPVPTPSPAPSSAPSTRSGDDGSSGGDSGNACPAEGLGCWEPSGDPGNGPGQGNPGALEDNLRSLGLACPEEGINCKYVPVPGASAGDEDVGLAAALLMMFGGPVGIAAVVSHAYDNVDPAAGNNRESGPRLTDNECPGSYQSSIYLVEEGRSGTNECF